MIKNPQTVRVRVLRPFYVNQKLTAVGEQMTVPYSQGVELIGYGKAERVAEPPAPAEGEQGKAAAEGAAESSGRRAKGKAAE